MSHLWKCLKTGFSFEFIRKIKLIYNLYILGLNEEYDNIIERNDVNLKY